MTPFSRSGFLVLEVRPRASCSLQSHVIQNAPGRQVAGGKDVQIPRGTRVHNVPALSKYLGNAELGGQVEKSRTEIFSKYPDAEESRASAYFEYQVCTFLMKDTRMTTQEKFQELVKIRREFQKPVVKKHSVIIRPREWVVDDKKAGGVRANSSTVELKVNGDSIGIFHLNGGFGSYHVELPEGTNTLEFVAKIVAHSGQINDSCMVNFDVKGPAEYYPRIVLDRRVVRDCSPKAVCRSRRAQAGHKAVKSAVHSS